MKVRFLKTRQVQDGSGTTFEAGHVYDLPDKSAQRWLRRNIAEIYREEGESAANPAEKFLLPKETKAAMKTVESTAKEEQAAAARTQKAAEKSAQADEQRAAELAPSAAPPVEPSAPAAMPGAAPEAGHARHGASKPDALKRADIKKK